MIKTSLSLAAVVVLAASSAFAGEKKACCADAVSGREGFSAAP